MKSLPCWYNMDEMVGMSKEDNQFMDLVSQSIKLIDGHYCITDGHYCIGLPLKNKDMVLPNNRIVAEQRAVNLQRKFRKDLAFQADYTAFMEKRYLWRNMRGMMAVCGIYLITGSTIRKRLGLFSTVVPLFREYP